MIGGEQQYQDFSPAERSTTITVNRSRRVPLQVLTQGGLVLH
jgi:hypothetical protein